MVPSSLSRLPVDGARSEGPIVNRRPWGGAVRQIPLGEGHAHRHRLSDEKGAANEDQSKGPNQYQERTPTMHLSQDSREDREASE